MRVIDSDDPVDFLEPEPFLFELQRKAQKSFEATLDSRLKSNDLALAILSRRFIDCVPQRRFTPYVITELLYGHRWPEQERLRKEAAHEGEIDEDLEPRIDFGAAAEACEFLLGIRPDMLNAAPLKEHKYKDILSGIYVRFARERPLYARFADQLDNVIAGFNRAARLHLDPYEHLLVVK